MKRIIVHGTGSGWLDLRSMLPADVEIVGFVDKALPTGSSFEGRPVLALGDLGAVDFDRVVITARAADAMRESLVAAGVRSDAILTFYPSYSARLTAALRDEHARALDFLGIPTLGLGIVSMYTFPHASPVGGPDWVRTSALFLAAREVTTRGIPGAVAELGVFQGEFSEKLGELFPDRPFYLFDTFRGFDARDVRQDQGLSASSAGLFHDTSVAQVLARVRNPERCRVRAGYFPETAAGLEDERYGFVSLDVDLYAPTLAGLEYFVPRLSPGGYLFVHDCNNARFAGVRKAVDEFRARSAVAMFPLPDIAGTVVLTR